MFEHHTKPMLPRAAYLRRLVRHGFMALLIVLASLAAGIVGYHFFEGLSWIDAFVNAAMILGGMGPVNELHATAGKLFAGFYALYSGIVSLVVPRGRRSIVCPSRTPLFTSLSLGDIRG